MTNLVKFALTAVLVCIFTPTSASVNPATAEWPGSGTKPSMVAPVPRRSAEWPGSGTKPS